MVIVAVSLAAAIPTMRYFETVAPRLLLPPDTGVIWSWYFSQTSDDLHLPAAFLWSLSLWLLTTRVFTIGTRLIGAACAVGAVVTTLRLHLLHRWSPSSLGSALETLLWLWLGAIAIATTVAWCLKSRHASQRTRPTASIASTRSRFLEHTRP